MISGDAIATNEFWSITGPAGEGMMFTFGSDPRKRPTRCRHRQEVQGQKHRS